MRWLHFNVLSQPFHILFVLKCRAAPHPIYHINITCAPCSRTPLHNCFFRNCIFMHNAIILLSLPLFCDLRCTYYNFNLCIYTTVCSYVSAKAMGFVLFLHGDLYLQLAALWSESINMWHIIYIFSDSKTRPPCWWRDVALDYVGCEANLFCKNVMHIPVCFCASIWWKLLSK